MKPTRRPVRGGTWLEPIGRVSRRIVRHADRRLAQREARLEIREDPR